ncbi:MAG TPA: MlaD family protein [Streptosporangiaceae bacterium]
MILKRGVKLQLLVFALITVLGISYTAVRFIGVGRGVLNRGYTAYVDLTDSGGIFTNAEVTYRGVTVGRVGPIQLTPDGIRVRLNLNRGHHIPRNTVAVVANRSAVGEQYIDLQPRTDSGPYLDSGEPYTIPRQDTKVPVQTAELLSNLDKLVSSVDPQDLGTIVDEFDKAFAGSAADLQTILDSSDRLLKESNDSFPAASQLLDNSKVVLDTQRGEATNIRVFARNLAILTDEIRKDDPGLRSLLDNTIPAATESSKLISRLQPTLPVLLANLTSTGQVVTSRIDGLRSLLILYPATLAGAFTVTPGDGTEHFGIVLNLNSPAPCTQGYGKTKVRYPQNTKKVPAEPRVGCTLPHDSQQDVRGARNAPPPRPAPQVPAGATDGAGEPPGGADPASGSKNDQNAQLAAGSSGSPDSVVLAGYDPLTGAVIGPNGKRYVMGSTGGQQQLLGDASWKWLLLGPLAQ